MDASIIEPIEEYEWIIPMVVQDKKSTGEVCIYVEMRKMNDAFLHDPFLTPFIDEVLESVEVRKCIPLLMDSLVTIRS